MRDQPAGHTLQPTALLNEAFLKIFREAAPGFRDRQHFLATVSRAMRCILVDHARAKATRKRAPSGVAVALNFLVDSYQRRAVDLLALDEALDRLFSLDPDMVRIVELRFFGGLGVEETAQVIGQSVRTVEREWSAARSWLRRALS
jgi:RNA polymerase sigma factor (TIGR02999 family)